MKISVKCPDWMGRYRATAPRCVNTTRPLTHSLDYGEEGLAMKATQSVNAAQKTCPDCSGPLSANATRCMRCEYARRGPNKKRPCAGCGAPCRGERCRACWRGPDNQPARSIPRQNVRTACDIEGCQGKHQARGYCEKHYTRLKRTGSPTGGRDRAVTWPRCTVCDTRVKHHHNELCRLCWKESVRNHAPCVVQGCDEPHHARGYCQKHAHRVARHGDPHIARLRSIELVALLPAPGGECIAWTGTVDPRNGYGRAVYQGRQTGAHRLVWQQQVGPIPAGLELDHLCCNRLCVNVNHLEPVTGAENKRRRWVRWWARQEAV